MRWLSRFRLGRRRRGAIDPRHARAIIEAYGACLDRRPAGEPHRPERELPYSKEEIGRAILLALRFATVPETIRPLRHGFVELERYVPDDEWTLIAEYQRLDAAATASLPADRRGAAERVLRAVEERRERRVELLAILEREAGDGHEAAP